MAMAASILQASPFSLSNTKTLRIHSSGFKLGGIKIKTQNRVCAVVGLGNGLGSRKRSLMICNSSVNAKCSEGQGQTQTVIRQSPTITQAPSHSKSPSLDDGGDGFPPRDDGDGGGGGGGGGNWSGGFFFFGFLAFLGLLKDKEGEEDYRGSRRR
ncbi:hypothetical protein AALP_AA4G002600 [Arabis alpina]|uniref:Uncharacterized protein n=1 Tax=Arabis alpina TaxID=50452 RepID=A0A087H078_ARAAL|nr:hypothetical protein AALP_AA4G002600 [Arabis alpina]